MTLIPRPGILDIAPYVGGESKVEGREKPIRLASNENPLGASPKAVEAYKALAAELNRYPDGGALALRQAIAKRYDLALDRLVCGAGSDELISLLVRAYAGPGDEVLYSRHGFLMYGISARTVGATPVTAPERNLTADLEALLAAVTERTRLVFLANPNNPTGSYLGYEAVRSFAERLPADVLLVIDAAYAEYVEASDYDDGLSLVERLSNVVVLRTFSKIHGLAALRLGWAYGPVEVIDVLNRVRGPFNVSAAALAAGVAAINDPTHVERSRAHNARIHAWFVRQLQRLNLRAEPSVGNFVLVRFGDAPGAAAFLKSQGVLVRAVGAYGLPDHLRITLGTDEEMQAVVDALERYRQ
ncbi:histidinol phosphate aminotransferase apoenzyme [Tistlia consotensis]|uniref:Histidinol-phosphate aminotransferase n=1 Tax=Tistlia consotensis USBA 355 TaxID=560819 RepID=A0A1Y6B8Z3_9PROT|nr:histidinol-phosphate transaminase [Tistlia consotensis]SME91742.1 histidinol phosphate aminotransferase apoenzyme [Tistlia consotensis USBA 355]SNR27612.1 histidinol phosphate aminotransferase apoenzyme [Tistlia consotensis]